MQKRKNEITYRVTGKRALFTDPVTKMGGEKSTYSIPTYEALRGITESIYWKPTIEWIIKEVRIVNKIKKVSSGQRVPNTKNNKCDLAVYQYLSDVCYEVRASFIFNSCRPDLKHDYIEPKHWEIAKRCVAAGGRFPIFLGCSECVGLVEPCKFGAEPGYYDNIDLDFDSMFGCFSYPEFTGGPAAAHWWSPKMVNGVIGFSKMISTANKIPLNRLVGPKNYDRRILSVNKELEALLG